MLLPRMAYKMGPLPQFSVAFVRTAVVVGIPANFVVHENFSWTQGLFACAVAATVFWLQQISYRRGSKRKSAEVPVHIPEAILSPVRARSIHVRALSNKSLLECAEYRSLRKAWRWAVYWLTAVVPLGIVTLILIWWPSLTYLPSSLLTPALFIFWTGAILCLNLSWRMFGCYAFFEAQKLQEELIQAHPEWK